MDENEWNNSRDVEKMLAFVGAPHPPSGAARPPAILTERRLRLFLVGCCRRQWAMFEDPVVRRAVSVAERFADGLADEVELEESHRAAVALSEKLLRGRGDGAGPGDLPRAIANVFTAFAASSSCSKYSELTQNTLPRGCRIGVQPPEVPENPGARSLRADHCLRSLMRAIDLRLGHDEIERAQADLLRCVTGSPFREVRFEPAWRSSDVVGLARSIYQERAFDRLPILSDALLDAGCNEEAIVAHCRDGLPHTRGCWVVDLIFGTK